MYVVIVLWVSRAAKVESECATCTKGLAFDCKMANNNSRAISTNKRLVAVAPGDSHSQFDLRAM